MTKRAERPERPRPAGDARDVAARVLVRVAKDGAFAAAALEAELERAARLDARDRAFATELVYGALRARPWLEARLAAHAPRGLEGVPPDVLAHLVIAAEQLFFSRVPAFAAVSQGVDAVRAAKGERLAAFANAVLRKVASDASAPDPNRRAEAVASSVPAWLKDGFARALGADGARAMLAACAEAPPLGLRVEVAIDRAEQERALRLAELAAYGAFEPGRASPLAIVGRGAGKPAALPPVASGALTVQEEGSQCVALALGARPGEVVLDACAGRGNKTAILARAVGDAGAAHACDVHPAKLERLARELGKLGLRAETFAVDWSVGAGDVTGAYDRVLVDAPCSGSGTLRRRPELLARRAPDDLARLSALQRAILATAAGRVRPGGRLVYAVCSVLVEEAEDVARAFLEARPEFRAAPFDAPGLACVAGASSIRLLPWTHGTDGYFLASFVRAPSPTA